MFKFLSITILMMAFEASGFDLLKPRDLEISLLSETITPISSKYSYRKYLRICQEDSKFDYCDELLELDRGEFQITNAKLERFLPKNIDLFFVGERHIDSEPKVILRKWLKELYREYGYRTLALEMFNQSSQGIIDEYLKGKKSKSELEVQLKNDWGYESQEYMNLIEEAKALGMKIVALDDRENVDSKLSFSEQLEVRDRIWSKRLIDHWNQYQEKTIILAGKMHAYRSFHAGQIEIQTIAEELEEKLSLKSYSLHVFSKRGRGLVRRFVTPEKNLIHKSPALSPYLDAQLYQLTD